MPSSKLAPSLRPTYEQVDQGVDVSPGHRPPICTAGQRSQDLPGAGFFRLARQRPTTENAAPALGRSGPVRRERPADQDIVDRHPVDHLRVATLGRCVLGQNAGGDLVIARRQRQPHLEIAGPLVGFLRIEIGVQQPHAPPVNAQVDPRRRQPGRTAATDPDRERVFGIEGEEVPEQEAAAQVRRQSVDLLVAGARARRVFLDHRPWCADADRQSAGAPRRRQVLLDVQRRHRQHIADVVEPVAGVVGRQVARVIEVEPQQVTHRVAVFRAIQPMDCRRARDGVLVGRAIELGLDPAHQARCRAGVRPRPSRRRHLAGPQFPQHLLEHRRLRRHVGGVHAGQRQTGGQRAVVVAPETVAGDRRLEDVASARLVRLPSLRAGVRNRNEASHDRHQQRHLNNGCPVTACEFTIGHGENAARLVCAAAWRRRRAGRRPERCRDAGRLRTLRGGATPRPRRRHRPRRAGRRRSRDPTRRFHATRLGRGSGRHRDRSIPARRRRRPRHRRRKTAKRRCCSPA